MTLIIRKILHGDLQLLIFIDGGRIKKSLYKITPNFDKFYLVTLYH